MGAGVIERSSGARGRRRGGTKPMSEINVTPFVDVMLVLLIIFMVAAPLLTVGVPINLPETAATPLQQDREEPLTITLDEAGLISIQESSVEREQLIPLLSEIAKQRSDDKIFLRADGAINYASVMEVMGALNAAGYKNIGLVTEGGGPTLNEKTE